MNSDTQQIQWDRQTAAATRQHLRRLAAQVRQRQDEEAARLERYRAAKKGNGL